jgi:hypothetical protein
MTTVISNVVVTNKNTLLTTTVISPEAKRNTLAYYNTLFIIAVMTKIPVQITVVMTTVISPAVVTHKTQC